MNSLLWLSMPEFVVLGAGLVLYLAKLAIRGPQKGADWIALEPDTQAAICSCGADLRAIPFVELQNHDRHAVMLEVPNA